MSLNHLQRIKKLIGPKGPQGDPGLDGVDGINGTNGTDGVGVPIGGATNEVLAKVSNTDYDTAWVSAGAGSGDVVGPASSVDNRVVRFDGVTGKLIQNSSVTVDDSGNLTANNISGTNTGDQTLPVGANPTATAKDTVVNGSATSFMRSDGAPAVQKATSSQFGLVKVDGTTITETGGVISSTASGTFAGALVKPNADIVNPASINGAGYAIAFDDEVYDTTSIHDNATQNTRLSVPSGKTKVRLIGNVDFTTGVGVGTTLAVWITKNGALVYSGGAKQAFTADFSNPALNLQSPVLNVTGGTDYFELFVFSSDATVTIESDTTWFAMEIIA